MTPAIFVIFIVLGGVTADAKTVTEMVILDARLRGRTLRLLNALNSEDRGLKVRFSLATIAFETFELILGQMLSSQGKNAPSNPYPHYLVRFAASRYDNTAFQEGF